MSTFQLQRIEGKMKTPRDEDARMISPIWSGARDMIPLLWRAQGEICFSKVWVMECAAL